MRNEEWLRKSLRISFDSGRSKALKFVSKIPEAHFRRQGGMAQIFDLAMPVRKADSGISDS